MGDRDLTLDFFGRDVSASAVAEKLAAKLKVLEGAQNDNSKAADDLDKKLQNAGKSAENANNKGFSPLLDSAILLGPAIVPIGAAALAAGAGLAGMGATAILAFAGIKREIDKGTVLGMQYEHAFKPVVDEFHQLEHIAAGGVFDGINRGIQSSRTLFPQLNSDVALLSTRLGDVAGNIGAGLVALFHNLTPLFVTMADQVDKLSGGFLHWAQTSDGVTKFVEYAQQQLPGLEKLLGEVALAIGHIGAAAAPLGGLTVKALTDLAAAIDALPLPVLTGLILALQVSRIASIASSISGLADGFKKLGGSMSLVSGVQLGAIAAGAGALVIGLQALVNYLDQGSIDFDKLAASQSGYFSALQASHGVVDDSIRQTISQGLVNDGLANKLDLTKISLAEVTDAVTQNDEFFGKLITHWVLGGSISKDVAIGLISLHEQFKNAAGQQKSLNDATAQYVTNADGSVTATSNLTAAQVKAADAARNQSKAILDLNNALLAMQGAALTAEQEELKLKDALAGAKQQVDNNAKAYKDSGKAINDNTAEGRNNKEWLLTQIGAINQHYASVLKQTGSVKQATAALNSDEAQLRASAAAAGFNTGQVNTLIRAYGQVPADVATKLRTIDNASGVIQGVDGQLRALDGRIVYTTIETQHLDIFTVQDAAANRGAAGVTSHATGGFLTEGWNRINEMGPEYLYKQGSQVKVYPHGTGGPAGGSHLVVNVNVGGSVVTDRQLVSAVADGIDVARKRRGRVSILDA